MIVRIDDSSILFGDWNIEGVGIFPFLLVKNANNDSYTTRSYIWDGESRSSYRLGGGIGSRVQTGDRIYDQVLNSAGSIAMVMPIDGLWRTFASSQVVDRYIILLQRKGVGYISGSAQLPFIIDEGSLQFTLQSNQRYGQGWSGSSLGFSINVADTPDAEELERLIQANNIRVVLLDRHVGSWLAEGDFDLRLSFTPDRVARCIFAGQTFGAISRGVMQGNRRSISVLATDGLGSVLGEKLFVPRGYYFTLGEFIVGLRDALGSYDIGLIENWAYRHSRLAGVRFEDLAFASPEQPVSFTETLQAIASSFVVRVFFLGRDLVFDFLTPDIGKVFRYHPIWEDVVNGQYVLHSQSYGVVPYGNIDRSGYLVYPVQEELVPETSQVQAQAQLNKRAVFELKIEEDRRTAELTHNFPQAQALLTEIFTGNAVSVSPLATTGIDFFIGANNLNLELEYAIDTSTGLDIFLWRLQILVDGQVESSIFRVELDDTYKEFETLAVEGMAHSQGALALRSVPLTLADIDQTHSFAPIPGTSVALSIAPLNRYNFTSLIAPDADSPFRDEKLFELDMVRALTGLPLVGNYTFGRGSGPADEYTYSGVLNSVPSPLPDLLFFEDDVTFENKGIFWDDVRCFHGQNKIPFLVSNRQITAAIVNTKLTTRIIREGYNGSFSTALVREIRIPFIKDGDIVIGIENTNTTLGFVRRSTGNRADRNAAGFSDVGNPQDQHTTRGTQIHTNWWDLEDGANNTLALNIRLFELRSEQGEGGDVVFTASEILSRSIVLTNGSAAVPNPYEVIFDMTRSTVIDAAKNIRLYTRRIVVKPRTDFINYMFDFTRQILDLLVPSQSASGRFYFKKFALGYSLVNAIDYGVKDSADISAIGIKSVAGSAVSPSETFLRYQIAPGNAFPSEQVTRRSAGFAEYYTPSALPNSSVLYWTNQLALRGQGYDRLQDDISASLGGVGEAWQDCFWEQVPRPLLAHLARRLYRLRASRRRMRKGVVFVDGRLWRQGNDLSPTSFDLFALLLNPQAGVMGNRYIGVTQQVSMVISSSYQERVTANFVEVADATEITAPQSAQFDDTQFSNQFDI